MEPEAYFEAIRSGNVERLRELVAERPELLEARTNPDYAPERQVSCTGLHVAVYARQPDAARVLVDSGIEIEARTAEGRTALHDSIEFGVQEITDLLIDRGAEVDICSAAILGRLERLRELLDRNPELANDRSTGLSPLGWASFGNQVDTATELIARGARLDDGELLCAASVGHVEVGRLLIEKGAKIDELFSEACGNALHAAVGMRYTGDSRDFIRMLLDAGADINAKTTDGRTALQLAEDKAREQEEALAKDPKIWRKQFEAVAELLRSRGAEPPS
jgi:ankyrin repeat protein